MAMYAAGAAKSSASIRSRTSVAAEQPAAVLDLHVTLDRRFEDPVLDRARERDHRPEHDRFPDREERVAVLVEREECYENGRRASRLRTPTSCPARARARACAGRKPPREVGGGIAGPDREQDGEDREPARVVTAVVAEQEKRGDACPNPHRAQTVVATITVRLARSATP